MADDALLLDRRADDEAGHVVQEHERDVERVAQPHEARGFVGRVHVERATEHHRLVPDDAHGLTADARQARDEVLRPLRLHPEHVAVVDDLGHDLAHVVRAPRRGRHDVVQLLGATIDRVSGGRDRWALLVVLREEREVLADDRQAFLVVGDFEIGDTADLGVDRGTAHLFLGDVLPHCRLHEVAPAERHRRRALHHRHEVGERGDVRSARRAVSEHRGHHRHDPAHRDLLAEQRARARERRAARRLDARARAVEQPHERDALADCVPAHARDLVFADRAHRARHHREVVRRDRDRPPVDLADTGDRAVGREVTIAEPGVHVVGEQPVLDPRSRVEQQIEPFAHGELAELALAYDPIGATHLERARLALREIADERTPVVLFGSTPRSAPLRSLRVVSLSAMLSSLPLRRALLRERGHALGRVFGARRDGEHAL